MIMPTLAWKRTDLLLLVAILLVRKAVTDEQALQVVSNGSDFMKTLLGASALPLNIAVAWANVSEAEHMLKNTASFWDSGQLRIVGVSDHQRPMLDLGGRSEVSVRYSKLGLLTHWWWHKQPEGSYRHLGVMKLQAKALASPLASPAAFTQWVGVGPG